jgi:hypothetical protein
MGEPDRDDAARSERDDDEPTRRVATGGAAGEVDGERVGDARPPASPGSDEGLIDDHDRMPGADDLPSQPPTR